MILGRTRKKPRSRSRNSPRIGANGGIHSFKVRTRIAKAVGEDKRYKLNAVRALPSREKGKVVLQATNGQQAVCVLAPGRLSSPRLVPSGVLPTRQTTRETVVDLIGDHWRSSDGKTEPDQYAGDSCYPALAEVLPEMTGKPFCVKPASNSKGEAHMWLGIDMSLLTRIAQSLGTEKLSLLVPVPVRSAGDRNGERYVNKPVLICPATDEHKVRGIGVLMPLQPVNGMPYYMKVRQAVADAETKSKPITRTRGSRVKSRRRAETT
jgi:hypothetical protein